MLCFLALVAGGVFHKGLRASQVLKYACIWIGIAGIVGLGYAYRFELGVVKDRFLAELVPGAGVSATGGEIQFRADSSGHFIVEALVNGVSVRFLVDTGASDVTLSPRDAGRIGLDANRLNFNRPYRTANGVVMGAPVTLPSIRIGPIEVRNVPGSVNGAPLGASLLGMSFLERLRGYRVENGTLILRQ
jgi:aspartyl protease family protein